MISHPCWQGRSQLRAPPRSASLHAGVEFIVEQWDFCCSCSFCYAWIWCKACGWLGFITCTLEEAKGGYGQTKTRRCITQSNEHLAWYCNLSQPVSLGIEHHAHTCRQAQFPLNLNWLSLTAAEGSVDIHPPPTKLVLSTTDDEFCFTQLIDQTV